jgi:enoyl-CoA hydratase/carnithine racemase
VIAAVNGMACGEVMRMSLLGAHERPSAGRAREIGLVSQVVPAAELHDVAGWEATAIASQPTRAVQATVRSLWAARELSAQQTFSSGTRIEWHTR